MHIYWFYVKRVLTEDQWLANYNVQVSGQLIVPICSIARTRSSRNVRSRPTGEIWPSSWPPAYRRSDPELWSW